MNRRILRIAVAIIGLADAQGAPAQQAIATGSGMNLSVAYPDGAGAVRQTSAGVMTGSGESQTAEHVGPVEGGFRTPGYTVIVTGSGENRSVGYVRNAVPAAPHG
ncbi:hypothetical protein [Neoroseomonas lacus]|uniref:Uncharacterized protein n=1 Tax=Neoroseomonas lacus TaxID=287609 RepID=A0A917K9Q8_9PROT|nr:hypothetical protein [Neoroseomonas lacus]GGJ03917.1 hypothetical protein GCM10011320_08670 [Neoroseomonas lacus]